MSESNYSDVQTVSDEGFRSKSNRKNSSTVNIALEELLDQASAPPVLQDGLSFIRMGAKSILQDDFTDCFLRQSNEPTSSAGAILKVPVYIIGWCIRYFLLFPYRLLHLLSATLSFFLILPFIVKFNNQPWKSRTFTYYCRAYLYSWGSRIRYHGKKSRLDVPHIFVSNHTSFIDYIVLSSDSFVHSTIAQKHGGIIGWFETFVLTLVGSLIFDRTSSDQRHDILPKIKKHVHNKKSAPLLVFPEGTCVNNEYTVLFHKGIFELDCAIVPVAIKYDKSWADAYWHTKTQTFSKHLFYLMTRWTLIADVWYLPPQTRKPGQSASDFAAEIKALISEVAGLKNLSWDGYYKHFVLLKDKQASLRASPQTIYVNSLLKRLDSSIYSTTGADKKHKNHHAASKPIHSVPSIPRVTSPDIPPHPPPITSHPPPISIAPEVTPPSSNTTFSDPLPHLSAPEDSTRFKNKFLVEIANTCNISVLESYSTRHADMINAFESFATNEIPNYSKIITDNIAERSWFRNRIRGITENFNNESSARLKKEFLVKSTKGPAISSSEELVVELTK